MPSCSVRRHRTSIPAAVQEIQCVQGGCALVRGGSSTSNLIENLHEPQHHRDSKVCRGLSHEFGVVRPYRTFSMYSVTGETRSAGCLCTSSGSFKHIEPHQTYSNHNSTEIARCGEACHMSSGWFDCTEPSLATSLKGKQGVHGAYALVQGGSSTSNHFITEIARCGEF